MSELLRFPSHKVGATLYLTPELLERLKQLYDGGQGFPARKED